MVEFVAKPDAEFNGLCPRGVQTVVNIVFQNKVGRGTASLVPAALVPLLKQMQELGFITKGVPPKLTMAAHKLVDVGCRYHNPTPVLAVPDDHMFATSFGEISGLGKYHLYKHLLSDGWEFRALEKQENDQMLILM